MKLFVKSCKKPLKNVNIYYENRNPILDMLKRMSNNNLESKNPNKYFLLIKGLTPHCKDLLQKPLL